MRLDFGQKLSTRQCEQYLDVRKIHRFFISDKIVAFFSQLVNTFLCILRLYLVVVDVQPLCTALIYINNYYWNYSFINDSNHL